MPFTPAHVAAVLPLARRTSGRPGWTAALVAGSMAPDLPYFVPARVRGLVPVDLSREATHSLVALPTTAAVIGLAVALLWDRVVEPVVRDALPRGIAGRLRAPGPRASWRQLPVLYLLTVAGVVTHDLWDSFTHSDGSLTERVAWLRDVVAGVPVWSWLQLASSGLGLLGVGALAVVVLRRRPVRPVPRRAAWIPLVVGVLGAAALAVGIRAAWTHRSEPLIDALVWFPVTRGGGAAALGLALLCGAWWLSELRRPRPHPPMTDVVPGS